MAIPTLLLGGTGLVGQAVARRLNPDRFDPVWLLVRRAGPRPQPHHQVRVVNFSKLEECRDIDLTGGSVICALGTTIRKAGSRAAFQAVDRDRVVHTAHWARGLGARHLLFVSSTGADPNSRNFYLRTKGQAEQELMALGFDRLTLLRPSLLLGTRTEVRIGERFGMAVGALLRSLLSGPLLKYRPVAADQVAEVLTHRAADPQTPALDIWESDRITRFAAGNPR